MQVENAGEPIRVVQGALREKTRKVAIVLLLLTSLWPALAVNIGVNAQSAGWSDSFVKLSRPIPSFAALLLSQVWALFASISPFNYTMHFEVELTNGQITSLLDLPKEAAGKWQSVLFHNEPKTSLNLYADRMALRYYMEYLIRSNGINPAWVVRRTISLRYRSVLPRAQAALAGTHYGPEATRVIDNY